MPECAYGQTFANLGWDRGRSLDAELPDLVVGLRVSVPAGKYECVVCGVVFDVRAQTRAAVAIRTPTGSTKTRVITVNGDQVHACDPSAVPRCAPHGSVKLVGSWLVAEPVCRSDWTLSPTRDSRFTHSATG